MNRTISSMLFHFTGVDKSRGSFKSDIEANGILKSILNSKYLLLSPNKVKIKLPEGTSMISNIESTLHMACLTETPLEFITDHIKSYGKFGLGFDINWAIRNGGQNVVYCDDKSPNSYAHTISDISNYFYFNGLSQNSNMAKWMAELVSITEDYQYRDEREWRFLRAPVVNEGRRGINFGKTDLNIVICPKAFIEEISIIINQNDLQADIEPTEKYLS